MEAGELLESQLERLFSDAWRPEPVAALESPLPAKRGITINIPLPLTWGGPPGGEWRAGFRRARRRLARMAAVEWRERVAAARAARKSRAELEREARRRADRRAAAQIRWERQRLLRHLLDVGDNLEQALAHAEVDDPLREGVLLTLRALTQRLEQERVEPIQALGRTFDPRWHEAVATDGGGADADTVVEVLERGYTLGGELLRPARVVVGRRKE